MPTQVQRRQSEPIPVTQKSMQQHQALRLALGSILTPKRPPVHQNSTTSSGAASPAVFYAGAHSSSGSHTPIGSPPSHPNLPSGGSGSVSYFPLAQGPNSSEHLHPYHPQPHTGHTRSVSHPHTHGHSHTHIPIPPSRLGPGRSTSGSPTSSAPNSSYPSPSVNSGLIMAPPPSDIEPLSIPPPIIVSPPHVHAHQSPHNHNGFDFPPPTPSAQHASESTVHHPSVHDPPTPSATPHDNSGMMVGIPTAAQPTTSGHDANSNGSGGHASGRGTPRAKFLETLQGKSAWDALIHGSFS